MKNLIRACYYHLRCSVKSFIWCLKVFKNEGFSGNAISDLYKGRIMILANGPSLKEVLNREIHNIESSEISVVNDFARTSFFFKLKPKYYVLADPFFFSDFDNERNREIHEAFSKVDWQMNLYVPCSVYRLMGSTIKNPLINVKTYHCQSYNGWQKIKYLLYKKGLTMPRAQNVLIPSIFIAINNGFKDIELYGVDHSWTEEIRVNDNNEVCYLFQHFYDKSKQELKPWYRGNGEPVFKMHEILRALAWMFEGYHELRKYADSVDCKIINRTPNSFIDAFERGSVSGH